MSLEQLFKAARDPLIEDQDAIRAYLAYLITIAPTYNPGMDTKVYLTMDGKYIMDVVPDKTRAMWERIIT